MRINIKVDFHQASLTTSENITIRVVNLLLIRHLKGFQ